MANRRAFLITLAVALALVAKLLLTRYLILGVAFAPLAVASDVAFVVALVLIVDALAPDHRLGALFFLDLVVTVVMVASVMYANHYAAVPTAGLIPLAGQLSAVSSAVRLAATPVLALYAIDLVLLGGLSIAMAARRLGVFSGDATPERPAIVRLHGGIYLVAVPAIVVFAIAVGRVAGAGASDDGRRLAAADGLFAYQVATIVPRQADVSGEVDTTDPRAVQRAIDQLNGGGSGVRVAEFERGSFAGKNVVIVQVEALQSAAVDAKVGGVPVMPNLSRLASQSWYFPNTLANVGRGTTVDAEWAENTSLYPPAETASSQQWADRKARSLPRLLAERGYDSLTFHANTVHFWNRGQFYRALGFTQYFDDTYFGSDDRVGMGASDEVLFAKTVEELERRRASGKPFYAEVITLSSHYPYDSLPASKRRLGLAEPYAGTLTGAYLQNMEYVDRALGRFLGSLEAAGLSQDTVVVVVGDHFGIKDVETLGDEAAAQRALFGRQYNEADRVSVPMVVHLPGQTEGRLQQGVAAQVDVMPTIADLLGIDLSGTPHVGRSLFVKGPRVVAGTGFLAAGSYADDNYVQVTGATASQSRAFAVSGHAPVPQPADAASMEERARALLEVSRAWADSLPRDPASTADPLSVIPR